MQQGKLKQPNRRRAAPRQGRHSAKVQYEGQNNSPGCGSRPRSRCHYQTVKGWYRLNSSCNPAAQNAPCSQYQPPQSRLLFNWDLRTRLGKCLDDWFLEQLPQVGSPLLLVGLVNGSSHPAGVLPQRNPGQATIRPVISRGRGLAARALLRPGQLLEAAVKRLHLPAHMHGLNYHFAGQMSSQMYGNEQFNTPFVATS